MIEFFLRPGIDHLAEEVIAKAREDKRAIGVVTVGKGGLVVRPEEFLPAIFHGTRITQNLVLVGRVFELCLNGMGHEFLGVRILFSGGSRVERDRVSERALLGLLNHQQAESTTRLMDGARQAVYTLALGQPSSRHVEGKSQAFVGIGVVRVLALVQARGGGGYWRSLLGKNESRREKS